MLIDPSFFIGDINIPNTDRADVQENLTHLINRYEPEFLKKVLSYGLWKAYDNNDANIPWGELEGGAEYTDSSGKLQYWEGFVQDADDDLLKRSPIANYIYYQYMRLNATQTAMVGETSQQSENSTRVSPIRKMVDAWNSMCKSIDHLTGYLDANKDTFTAWDVNYKYQIRREFQTINVFGI